MPKLNITDHLVQECIRQVAPLVSLTTGWDLDLPNLRSRVLPKEQGYEEILVGRLEQLGLIGWQEMLPGFLERLIEYMVEANTLAAYMPSVGEILVLRENVDDSNLDGLKLVLAHELVHRGQHIAHGHLFSRVDGLLREAFIQMKSEDTDIQHMRQMLEQVQPIMTLLESHAAYVQGLLRQTNFPKARVESHFNLATLLMRLFGAPKVAQYTDGLPQVAAAVKAGRLESLYTGFGD